MPTRNASVEKYKVREIAEQYRRRGYTVQTAPKPAQLPDFLAGFRPDLIAEAPDEEKSVVVEVKATGTVSPDYWKRLAETIATQPKWRLEILVTDPEESTPRENLDESEIQSLLAEGDSLNRAGQARAALLLIWGRWKRRYVSRLRINILTCQTSIQEL